MDVGIDAGDRVEGSSSITATKSEGSDQDRARRLMASVKESIIKETPTAISAYANLRRSGKHIIWVPTR